MRFDNDGHYKIYPGTQTDFKCIEIWTNKGRGMFEPEPVFVALFVVDVPISLVTDTLILPADLYFICTRNEKKNSNRVKGSF